MPVYLDLVMGLNFAVDFMLLLGTNRLAGHPAAAGRACLAAALGGIYGGVCLLPEFRFLGSTLWRLVSLGLMGVIAFGLQRSTIRRCVLFVLLSMALGGLALGLGGSGGYALIAAAGGLCALCMVGFRRQRAGQRFVPVELRYGGKTVRLLALHDTGNSLRDPVTGEPVIVAGPDAAWTLLGLDREMLRRPVEIIAQGKTPGLRLIPYRAVGQDAGLLLCTRFSDARLDGRKQSLLVAFAPDGLGGEYQALIGGLI